MKLVMDADCLIKLTKANLKEEVCRSFSIVIPMLVRKEVVDDAEGHPDSAAIERNIQKGLLEVGNVRTLSVKGEQDVIALYQEGSYDAICSDDKRFINRLRILDIPYVTPAVFLLLLLRKKTMDIRSARNRLEILRPYVSHDEYAVVKFALDNWRVQ